MTALYDARVRLRPRRIGHAIQMNDMGIAAVCLEHDLVLTTRDSGFQYVEGLHVLRW